MLHHIVGKACWFDQKPFPFQEVRYNDICLPPKEKIRVRGKYNKKKRRYLINYLDITPDKLLSKVNTKICTIFRLNTFKCLHTRFYS